MAVNEWSVIHKHSKEEKPKVASLYVSLSKTWSYHFAQEKEVNLCEVSLTWKVCMIK